MLAGLAQVIVGVVPVDGCHCHIVAPGAVKKSEEPMTAKFEGVLLAPVVRLVSITVPAAVPLLSHTWNPFLDVYAAKYSVPFTSIRFVASEVPVPLMSATIAVPLAFPVLDHNWSPSTPLVPTKYSVLPTAVSSAGLTPPPLTLALL